MNYIDLDLPSGTLWADCNVGANKPEEYGNYFNFEDAQKCGALPAHWQMRELIDFTTHKVCKVKGVKGMRLTGKNGNSIFMPFAGFFDDGNTLAVGLDGCCWSCTPHGSIHFTGNLHFTGYILTSDCLYMAFGFSVRLIKKHIKGY